MNFLDGVNNIEGDIGIAVLISLSAILTFVRIAFERHGLQFTWARSLMGFGFTIWAIRFWVTLLSGGDVIVAPISIFAITLICTGYCATQMLAIKRMRDWESLPPIKCFKDPEFDCQRHDRIKAAMDNRR